MSVKTQNKQMPKFTSMEEMKRWQGEREDRLHREHIRKKLLRSQATKHDQWAFDETQQRQLKAQVAAKPPKKPK